MMDNLKIYESKIVDHHLHHYIYNQINNISMPMPVLYTYHYLNMEILHLILDIIMIFLYLDDIWFHNQKRLVYPYLGNVSLFLLMNHNILYHMHLLKELYPVV